MERVPLRARSDARQVRVLRSDARGLRVFSIRLLREWPVPTPEEEQKLNSLIQPWISPEEAIALIRAYLKQTYPTTTDAYAHKLLMDATRVDKAVQFKNADDCVTQDPRFDYLYHKADLLGWLHWKFGEPQAESAPQQPEPVTSAQEGHDAKPTPPAARGRKPTYDRTAVRTFVFGKMDYHGDFDPTDKEWSCQADLERAIGDYMQQQGLHPDESTLRLYAAKFSKEWKGRKG
jgi:hypothetical protein